MIAPGIRPKRKTGLPKRVRELELQTGELRAEGADLTRELLPVRSDEPIQPAVEKRILVVDDVEPIREVARTILEKAGYGVIVAADGTEAVAAVRDTEFDLVLMDLHMPRMNGLTATRAIRRLGGRHSTVPIVGMSANVPLQHVRTLLAGGMSDHLAKPFRRDALLQVVHTWLESTNPGAERPTGTPVAGNTFDEICNLMGRPWARSGLAKLEARMDEAFGSDLLDARQQDGRLAGQAHALVSLAAMLGFSTLSQLCAALEQACRSGFGVSVAFERAQAAACNARKTAAGLIASEGLLLH